MSSTTVFAVIGCRRSDPQTLLLQGDDGSHYVWMSPSSEPALIDDELWATDWFLDQHNDQNDDPFDSLTPLH